MMSCKRATELTSQALDRQLSLPERLALGFHILICDGCRNTRNHFLFLREAVRNHPRKL